MGHGADDKNHATPRERLDAAGATDVAATLQALATALFHIEHLRLGLRDAAAAEVARAPARR